MPKGKRPPLLWRCSCGKATVHGGRSKIWIKGGWHKHGCTSRAKYIVCFECNDQFLVGPELIWR